MPSGSDTRPGSAREQPGVADGAGQHRVRAEILGMRDGAGRPCSASRMPSGRMPAAASRRSRGGASAGPSVPATAPLRSSGSRFIGGVPMKLAANPVAGARIELGWRRVLLDPAVAQQHDLVGHAHRLGLVVRDVEHRDAETPLQREDLAPHLGAKLGVEIGERLVHQAHRRFRDDGAAERHALLLAAGELAGPAVEQMADAEDLDGARPAGVPLGLRHAARASARRRCSPRRSDAGTARRTGTPSRRRARPAAGSVTSRPPISTRAARRLLKPGDDAQAGGLAAAGRSEQHAERPAGDMQAHAGERRRRSPAARDATAWRRDGCSGRVFSCSTWPGVRLPWSARKGMFKFDDDTLGQAR